MKFWHDYMDRNPILAMAWMRLVFYQYYGKEMQA
jgi:hypothetical protein